MAKFIEVIHEWVRMCKTYSSTGDRMKCPMARSSICGCISDDNGASNREFSETEASKIEATIMSWAAEHPEPVYPSWIDWLMANGIIPDSYSAKHSMESGVRAATFYVTSKAFTPIPTDIAQKLGIKPKENN